MQTLNQQWASVILLQVEAAKKQGDPYSQKYGSMSHKLPVLIRTAGLAQAAAFVEARGETAHHQLLTDLAATLGYDSRKTFLDQIYQVELNKYMYLTQRSLAALLWYKRFAQSVLGVAAGDEPADETTKEDTAHASAAQQT